MPKLNQVLAVEKGVKTRVYAQVTDLHKATQKSVLMNGFEKNYQRKSEDGENYPKESQKVQFTHTEVTEQIAEALVELFDIIATKDFANCKVKADVEVDGEVIIKDAPATYLLFLEKQLSDLQTFFQKMVELDSSSDWSLDPSTDLYKTEPAQTHRTKKVQRPIVLYNATEEHPAQTQLITEDVVVGHWTTVKTSGAIPKPKKKAILARIDKLSNAVKYAREQANSAEVEKHKVGKDILGYLFRT